MTEHSSIPVAEPGKGDAPNLEMPPHRSALKPQSPRFPPPRDSDAVTAKTVPVRPAVGAATRATSTTACAAASTAATLRSITVLTRNNDMKGKGDTEALPQAGDQRAGAERKPAAAESKVQHKSHPLTLRGMRKWKALRAMGNPMKPVCLALIVLCALLLVAVLGRMLFEEAGNRGLRGEQKRGANVTNHPPATTAELFVAAWRPTEAATGTTTVTSANNADATIKSEEDVIAGTASSTGEYNVPAADSILD